jgi:hypothetical protein
VIVLHQHRQKKIGLAAYLPEHIFLLFSLLSSSDTQPAHAAFSTVLGFALGFAAAS